MADKRFGAAGVRKPPRKLRKMVKIEKEAKARRKGEILGEYAAHKRKPLVESLKMHLGEIIERIDPIETIAIGGLTLMVHGVIMESTTYQAKSLYYMEYASFGLQGLAALGFMEYFNLLPKQVEEAKQDNIMFWIASFVIAFMLCRFGGQIIGGIGDIATKLPAMVGMFLG